LIGGVPPRVAAATKQALLGLVDQAVAEGFTAQAACRVLQVGERRVNRWQARRAAGTLADRPAGGGAVHGLLDEEVEQILDLAEEWGEIDRSPMSSAPNWRWSAPTTTPSGCTPGSAMSPPTTSTAAAAPRSAGPAARDLRGLAVGASPTIASTARRPGRDDPQMRSDQPATVGH
jgi:hypothetical protein